MIFYPLRQQTNMQIDRQYPYTDSWFNTYWSAY